MSPILTYQWDVMPHMIVLFGSIAQRLYLNHLSSTLTAYILTKNWHCTALDAIPSKALSIIS